MASSELHQVTTTMSVGSSPGLQRTCEPSYPLTAARAGATCSVKCRMYSPTEEAFAFAFQTRAIMGAPRGGRKEPQTRPEVAMKAISRWKPDQSRRALATKG